MKTTLQFFGLLAVTLLFISNLSYAQLDVMWTGYHHDSTDGEDNAYSLFVDGSGNSYLTGRVNGTGSPVGGYEVGTVKYNSAGQKLWSATYNVTTSGTKDMGRAITVDNSGNVYVAAQVDQTLNYWIIVLKYNSSGVLQWAQTYNSAGSLDEVYSMDIDNDGNIYVGGATSANGGRDMLLIKYSSSGIEEWVQTYSGPGNQWDEIYEVKFKAGSVYAAGHSRGNTSSDMTVLKYDTAGTLLWVTRHDGDYNSNLPDFGDGLYIDNSNNVYVTGFTQLSTGSYDFLTIKFNSSGVEQWASTFNSVSSGKDWAYGITGDGSGNIYVTGYSDSTSSIINMNTVKYNSSGVQQWARSYPYAAAMSIAIDAAGDINVTGTVNSKFAVVQYAPDGSSKADYVVNSAGRGRHITADANAIYAAGWDGGDYIVVKFDKDSPTGITNNGANIPSEFGLSQNYPNPFNPSTSINFDIPEAGNVQVIVYNALGKQVAALVNNNLTAGSYTVKWNAEGFSSGVYYYKLVTNSFTETKKMLLVK
jgi:hypothetical protein